MDYLQMAERGNDLADQLELSAVDLAHLESLRMRFEIHCSGAFPLELVATSPWLRESLLTHLQVAKGELSKLVGAEVTDPLVTDPFKAIVKLERLVQGIDGSRSRYPSHPELADRFGQSAEEGQVLEHQFLKARRALASEMAELMGDIATGIEVGMPYFNDKVSDGKRTTTGSGDPTG